MKHGSLFSGIGGFDLAAEWMGWENVFHCEWNPFGQRVLKHYWPNAESFEDITKTDFTKYHGTIDIISGGFPCQPYSIGGKRLGNEDERHLWPHMLRAIEEIAPRFVVGENVRGLTNWNGGMVFDEVCSNLENIGYSVTPYLIPACATNAPHKRERIWFIAANTQSEQSKRSKFEFNESCKSQQRQFGGINSEMDDNHVANPTGDGGGKNNRFRKSRFIDKTRPVNEWADFPTQYPVCGRNDGVPSGLDGITFSKWRNESIKAYGNAVVPQVVFEIFKSIEKFEQINERT
jgi:DNA (cytosine-5)-methyltransferase 1